jgi:UTP--glucose-1-phosphate uridylyltransferase
MKAVIPAAGLGLRFLPLTKEQPKEMIPVLRKPTIQYVVEEAIAAGITDIIIVTGRNKRAIEDHFDRSFELECILENMGRKDSLNEIHRVSNMVDIHYIRQKSPEGLGDAIYRARKHIGEEAFAVMLGDTINISPTPVIGQLMKAYERTGSSIIAVETVAHEKISDYGIVGGEAIDERLIKVEKLVEKPSPEEAPSNVGITGRYVLTPAIFECIERTPRGKGNEVQLTDALFLLSKKERLLAYRFEGRRYDIGDVLGWLKTTFELALAHPEYSAQLRPFLEKLLDLESGSADYGSLTEISRSL